jgi:hypothetical protein
MACKCHHIFHPLTLSIKRVQLPDYHKVKFIISGHLFTMTDQLYRLQLMMNVSYDETQAGQIVLFSSTNKPAVLYEMG